MVVSLLYSSSTVILSSVSLILMFCHLPPGSLQCLCNDSSDFGSTHCCSLYSSVLVSHFSISYVQVMPVPVSFWFNLSIFVCSIFSYFGFMFSVL